MTLHVAVVDRFSDSYASNRPFGDWAAFVGQDRQDVIQRAMAARNEWSRNDRYSGSRGGRTYRVLVGELTGEAREPVRYEVVPLEEQP